jgi:peptidoglycan/xylan/chitin deacetylase (PgdA/CDA1 family)
LAFPGSETARSDFAVHTSHAIKLLWSVRRLCIHIQETVQMMFESLQSAARRSVKHLTIQTGLEVAALPGAGRLFRSAAGRGVIFTLHHVRPSRGHEFEPNAHLSITPEFLDEAIVAVRQCGLTPVHLEDLPELLANPSDPRKFVCFTLDDGYRDNAEFAAPVFRKHSAPYTVFVVPGFVERTRTMWWTTAEELTRAMSSFQFDFGRGVETIRSASHLEKFAAFERFIHFVQAVDEDEAVAQIDQAAKRAGIDPEAIVEREVMKATELKKLVEDPLARLGAHTLTHPNLARVAEPRLRQELGDSAARIAGYCGQRPKVFAYPYGGRHAVGSREARVAMETGFSLAVTTQPGVLNSKSLARRGELARISLNGYYQKSRYVKALASGLPFWLMQV